jgi:hypothetical protein
MMSDEVLAANHRFHRDKPGGVPLVPMLKLALIPSNLARIPIATTGFIPVEH